MAHVRQRHTHTGGGEKACGAEDASTLTLPLWWYAHAFVAQLANTEEFVDGQFTGNLGEVLIRCAQPAGGCTP